MIKSTLKEISSFVKGKLISGDASFEGVSTDTRTIKRGELYVALKGPRFDGHNYINEAISKGAKGVVVNEDNNLESIPAILVKDTTYALGEIARFWRSKIKNPLVAITGSNGKSTTKEMVSSIMSTRGSILKTEGNFNNLIGMPLTILRWDEKQWSAVIEMGMNARGEIKRLTEIANPDVGVITTVTSAHLEHLHTVEAVASAKGELFEAMSDKSVAIINDEDPLVKQLGKHFKGRKITFGMQNTSDVRFLHMEREGWEETKLKIMAKGRDVDLILPVPGIHNVMNALASIAVGLVFDIEPEVSANSLRNFKPMAMRMERVQLMNGVCLVNDSYNANPASVKAALKTVSVIKRAGRFIAVLGDMLELGEKSKELHEKVGVDAFLEKVDILFVCGEHAKDVENGAKGKDLRDIRVYENKTDLNKNLIQEIKAGDVVLIKGSRGSRMDTVAENLKDTFGIG